jgi:predicted N-acyltransferase
MVIDLRIHESIHGIDRATWDGLDGVKGTPFLSWTWLSTLEKTGCVGAEKGWLPQHFTFWEGDRLVAAAPAYLKDNSEGEFVFDYAWAGAAERAGIPYYPKLLVAVPFTPATASRILVAPGVDHGAMAQALAQGLAAVVKKTGISSAHVLFPTEAEADALEAAGLAHRLGIQFHWTNDGFKTFDDFLAKFSSKRRNQIKRERREMDKLGIALTTARGAEITPEIVDAMYGFYTSTVDKFYWGRRYLNRAFFEEVTARLPGGIEVVLAKEGKKIIAGAFNLAGESALFGRYWGASVDRPFLHFNVCYYHSIDECIARGVSRFEAGAGGSHKLARGFEPSITHSAHLIADRRLDGATKILRGARAPGSFCGTSGLRSSIDSDPARSRHLRASSELADGRRLVGLVAVRSAVRACAGVNG